MLVNEHDLIKIGVTKLKKNLNKYGFMASGLESDESSKKNYSSLFTRDIGASSLGILASQDADLILGLRISLYSLAQTQSDLGQFPFSCKPEVSEVRWRFEAGSLDSTIWWCLGFLLYNESNPEDSQFFADLKPNFIKACNWLRYQDRNQDSLLEQGEASDWADEMPRRGTVLYTNALYYWMICKRLDLIEDEKEIYTELKESIYISFNTIFWVHKGSSSNFNYIPENQFTKKHRKDLAILERINSELVDFPYYLGYISHKSYEKRMDVLGNLIAIYSGLADTEKSKRIIDYIFSVGINRPYPVKVLYPTIEVGSNHWEEYMFRGAQNLPFHYHNGAIWPKATGFWIAVLEKLKKQELQNEYEKFQELVSLGDSGFHEYYHGLYGTPMGAKNQTWSIAMYLWATSLVKNK